MEKLLKNIHWFIIAFALFNMGSYYFEANEKITSTVGQQETQRQALQKAKKLKKEIADFNKALC